jgi:hypothetical protein
MTLPHVPTENTAIYGDGVRHGAARHARRDVHDADGSAAAHDDGNDDLRLYRTKVSLGRALHHRPGKQTQTRQRHIRQVRDERMRSSP